MVRLKKLLLHMSQAAKMIGNTELENKFSESGEWFLRLRCMDGGRSLYY